MVANEQEEDEGEKNLDQKGAPEEKVSPLSHTIDPLSLT